MSPFRLLLASCAVVLAAPFVLAADAPTLESLDRDGIQKGSISTVKASGTNFPDKPEEIAVTAGSLECKVTEATPKYFRFLVPGTLPLGPVTITMRVHGTTLTARLQVLDKVPKRPDGDPVLLPVTTTKLTLVGGEAPSAVVEGTTEIPVGLTLECQLVLQGGNGEDDCLIESREIRLEKPQFKVTFGPFPGKTLCPGNYFSMTEFQIGKAGALALQAAHWDKLDPRTHAAYARLWSKDTRAWGTPDEAKKALDELKAHTNDLTRGVTAVFESVELGTAAAGKSLHRKPNGGGLDVTAWTAWVQARGLGQTPPELAKLTADNRFVNNGGALVEKPWRDFLEKDVFKALVDLRAAQDAFHNKYVGVKNTKIDVEGYELISVVGKQAQGYAKDIYSGARLDLPDSIKNPTGIFEGHDVPGASRPEFENKRRVLLERLERVLASTAPAPTPSPTGKPK